MDIKELATQMLMQKLGGNAESNAAASALDDLVGGDKGFDLGAIVGKFTGSGGDLAQKAQSWLGDGSNESLSPAQLDEAIGSDKIEAFAAKVGVSKEQASSSLSQALPELIDKSSRGGSLLESIGGTKGLAGLASRFLK